MPSPTTGVNRCAGCRVVIKGRQFLKCHVCSQCYDLQCANVSEKRYYNTFSRERKSTWKCPLCKNKEPKQDNTDTPITCVSKAEAQTLRSEQVETPIAAHLTKSTDLSDLSDDHLDQISGNFTLDDPATELKRFWKEMRAVRTEMGTFRSAVADLTAALKAQNLRIDALETRVVNLEAKIGDGFKSESSVISNLEETIAQLKLEIDEREQDMLGNDIEIASFPETSNENPTHVILTVAKKLGVQLEERDVVSAARMGAPRTAAAATESGARARPRPIAVRLARRSQRDALLQAARVRRRLLADDVDLPNSAPPRPFYVNERLTRQNRQLFQKTRELAKQLNWQYVWTRDGKILTRQENGKARHRIRSEADFIRVFGINSVGEN